MAATGGTEVRIDADGGTVTLAGRLDVRTVADVRAALQRAVEAGSGRLVLEVGAVDVADATGLGVLVGAHRRAGRAGRTLVLRDVPPRLARLLLATRLHRVLAVESYRADAAADDALVLAAQAI